jgi:TolB-like protein
MKLMRQLQKSALLLAFAMLTGCVATTTNYPTNPVAGTQSAGEMAAIQPGQRYIASEPIGVQQSTSTVGRFNARMIFLADQIERNADRKALSNTFIVTSFVNLNRLSETTPFGRLVAENMIHELQVRKWHVFEVRLTKDIIVNESGEFSLSRDIKKLKEQYKIGGIVTGTYSISGGHVILNARVIDINTGVVASSGQIHLPVNWFVDELLAHDDNMKTMKVVGDTPYSCRELGTCTATTPFLPSYSKTPGATP